jgi:hypothetical protein
MKIFLETLLYIIFPIISSCIASWVVIETYLTK